MNTTAPRARAGKPYVYPMLHRVDASQLAPDDGVTVTPIQFAGPEPELETVEQYANDASEIAWVGWLLIACLLCVISSGLGYLAGRYFS